MKFLPDQSNYWMTDTSQSQAEPEVDSARGELKWWRTWWDAWRWQGPGLPRFGVTDAWLFLSFWLSIWTFDWQFCHKINTQIIKTLFEIELRPIWRRKIGALINKSKIIWLELLFLRSCGYIGVHKWMHSVSQSVSQSGNSWAALLRSRSGYGACICSSSWEL